MLAGLDVYPFRVWQTFQVPRSESPLIYATSQAINNLKRGKRGREDAIRSTHRTAPLLPPCGFCGQGTKTEKDGRMSHVSSPKSQIS
jgi:hypothetical protein